MNHIIHFLLLQLDPKEKVKFSNTLVYSMGILAAYVWSADSCEISITVNLITEALELQ